MKTKHTIQELKRRYVEMLPIPNEIEYLRNMLQWYDVRNYSFSSNKSLTQLQRTFLESKLGLTENS